MRTYIDHGHCLAWNGLSIPKDPKNADYSEALAMIAAQAAEITVYDPPSPTPPRVLHPEEFRALLTEAEVDAIATSTNAAVIKWRFRAATAKAINLDALVTTTLISGAVTLGILTQARADRVLSGLPPE